MLSSFAQLDRVLRGEVTRTEALRDGSIGVAFGGMVPVLTLLGMVNGACIGAYALANRESESWMHVISAMVKVPALFLLTLLVTFPSLYVFNAIVGCGLRALPMLRLIVAALAVTMALLASFGPIVAFFSFSTGSYSFMVLINVVTYGVAGSLGLLFLLRTLQRLAAISVPDLGLDEAEDEIVSPMEPVDAGPLGAPARIVFRIWVVVFGLVGAQMAWVLRPFIGDPGAEFSWFRPRQSSFFESVWTHVTHLF